MISSSQSVWKTETQFTVSEIPRQKRQCSTTFIFPDLTAEKLQEGNAF